MEEQTDLLGIPIPSTDNTFIAFVVVHIFISLAAVVSGLMAMLAEKTSRNHPRFGKLYFWSVSFSFVTVLILAFMRWPHNVHLLVIGVMTFGLCYTGRNLAQRKSPGWTRLHTICMGLSYVLLLTGFYVDNGKNLPFWRMFPQWFFYIFPSAIGTPIIIKILASHPLNKRY